MRFLVVPLALGERLTVPPHVGLSARLGSVRECGPWLCADARGKGSCGRAAPLTPGLLPAQIRHVP